MFTPEELEGIPEGIRHLFTQLEFELMTDIVNRISAIGSISRTADFEIYQLHYELGVSGENIKQMLQEKLLLADIEIDKIYDTIIKEGYARDEDIYKKVNKGFLPFDKNESLQQLIEATKKQTKGDLYNITQSTGFRVKIGGKSVYTPMGEHYQRILDVSMGEILTGSFDYNKVLKKTVKEMTDSGIRTVDYESGHTDRIEVAARRAVMTGITQVVSKITDDNAKALETDHFEISWHGTARPSHQAWQGRVYSKEELETVCGLGTITGLSGINCYHSYYPFIPGISERSYTDEELEKLNAAENTPKEFRGKQYTKYEAAQHQRKLERIMRAQRQEIKLLEKGKAKEEDIIVAKCRYRSTSQEYTEFSKVTGLPQQRERVLMDGLGRVGGGKGVTKSQESGIISSRIQSGEYSTKLSTQQYFKHAEGTKQYQDYCNTRISKGKTPQSIITIDANEAQEIINRYAGTGELDKTRTGEPRPVEYVDCDKIIGKYFDEIGAHDTVRMAIHYAKKGAHIVPVKERK